MLDFLWSVFSNNRQGWVQIPWRRGRTAVQTCQRMQYQQQFSGAVLPATSKTPPTMPHLFPRLPCKPAQLLSTLSDDRDVSSLLHVRSGDLSRTASPASPGHRRLNPAGLSSPLQKPAQLRLLHLSSCNKQLGCLRLSFPAQTRFFSCGTAHLSWETQTYRYFFTTLLINSWAAKVPDWPPSAFSLAAESCEVLICSSKMLLLK